MFRSIVEAVLYYAEKQPDKLCLADDGGSVTYSQYAEKILKFASYFKAQNIKKGSRVVVEASQSIDYLAIQLALQIMGIVFVPVERNCALDKIQDFIFRSKAFAVITNRPGGYIVDLNLTRAQVAEEAAEYEKYIPAELPCKDEVCEILFSTGTTGKEKGIIITNKNNVALAENVMYGVEMQEDNVEMIPSPMNHSHGLRRYYANMYKGASVVLLGSVMDIRRFFGNIDNYGVNSMDLVPSALTVVLKLSKDKLAEYADKLRYIQYGSAPLMQQDVEKVCALLPNTRMYNFYGSTESGCTCIYDFNRKEAKEKCIGKPTHNTTVIMVDEQRREIVSSPDNTGSIATKGAMNMTAYWQDKEETKRAMADGIIYSNDMGYIDDDGDIILMGRKGDVINVGGNKVSPDEIENAAKKMTGIVDCGCVGVEDSAKGQIPKLFVQMAPGADFDSKAIRSFLMASLEPYKVPVYIEQIATIPRTFNGKLMRKELKK